MQGHTHEHNHGEQHCCCGKEHKHSHVITAGSTCCSSCGSEAAAKPTSCCAEKRTGSTDDDTGESDEEGQPEHGCSCCEHNNPFKESFDEPDSFKKEIIYLAAVGTVFALTMAVEHTAKTDDTLIITAYMAIYLAAGFSVLKEMFASLRRGDIFNEFTLMGFASMAAVAVGAPSEAAGVMIFYRVGEAFQEKAANRSRRSIRSLLAQKPSHARVLSDGEIKQISANDVKKGDIIQVLPGEQIPIDGIVVSGTSFLDTSPITGESRPRRAAKGTAVTGGALTIEGMLMIEASGPFKDSTIQRILDMVQNASERKSPVERFITKFAKWYTPAVFTAASLIAVIPPLLGLSSFKESLYRGLVLLVISCPCALVISIPLGYFGGIGAASKKGILVKGSFVFDTIKEITAAVFDKTGTLTEGVFKITGITAADGATEQEVLEAAALAESASAHPIAKSIADAAGKTAAPEGAEVTQIPGKGVICRSGDEIAAAGSCTLIKELGCEPLMVQEHGTVVHVMKNGRYLGFLILSDVFKNEALDLAVKMRKAGIAKLYILSGDRRGEAEFAADKLGFDGYEAELLPDGKINALQRLSGGETDKTMFIGDGINDAPVLISAGIGVAMGALGSQAAVEAADVVILDDSPAKCVDLIKIAAKTRSVVWQNIVLSLGIKSLFMVLGAIGLAGLWEAVFADVGVAVMAILNAARASKV